MLRRCTTCGEYIYKGKKFNAMKVRVEHARLPSSLPHDLDGICRLHSAPVPCTRQACCLGPPLPPNYSPRPNTPLQETVLNETYLGLFIFRFYIRCPLCAGAIAFKVRSHRRVFVRACTATFVVYLCGRAQPRACVVVSRTRVPVRICGHACFDGCLCLACQTLQSRIPRPHSWRPHCLLLPIFSHISDGPRQHGLRVRVWRDAKL